MTEYRRREATRCRSTSDRGDLGDKRTPESWLCNVQLQLSLSEQLYKINKNTSLEGRQSTVWLKIK